MFADWLFGHKNSVATVSICPFYRGYNRSESVSYNVSKLLSTEYHNDCPDGSFHTFHRRSVPALLPYIEHFDQFN